MKKMLTLLLVSVVSLTSFNSCTKEYIDYYDLVPTITMVYEQSNNDWSGVDNNALLTINIPELTQYYINQGVVNVAISMDNEKSYHTIPATFEGVSYSYSYQVGKITIRAQDPILEDGIFVDVPSKAFIKVSLTETDWVE